MSRDQTAHNPSCRGLAPRSAHGRKETTDETALSAYWAALPLSQRRSLLRIPRRTLFEAIRSRFCSRCYGLFALRYEELRSNNGAASGDSCPACTACPACQDFFLGLSADDKAVTLEDRLLEGEPFSAFSQSAARERERDLQFMTAGDVCGSGFNARRSGKVCTLHTTQVSTETLLAYWEQLPQEHRSALFSLPRHDFEAELDSCCSLQLRICKDCRYNVMAQYKAALQAGRRLHQSAGRASADGRAADASGVALAVLQQPLLPVCDGFSLEVTDATVQLIGSNAAVLLEEAEEIEDMKGDGTGDDGGMGVRHAETPELAQEALLDAIILIFKAQVEVAFREQTAGHNALLLLVALSHELLEERLRNAFLDVHARRAEEELLELVAEDEKRQAQRSNRSRRRKKGATVLSNASVLPPVSASSLPPRAAARRRDSEDSTQTASSAHEEDSEVPAPKTPATEARSGSGKTQRSDSASEGGGGSSRADSPAPDSAKPPSSPPKPIPAAQPAASPAACTSFAAVAMSPGVGSPALSAAGSADSQTTRMAAVSWDAEQGEGEGQWEVQQRGRRSSSSRRSLQQQQQQPSQQQQLSSTPPAARSATAAAALLRHDAAPEQGHAPSVSPHGQESAPGWVGSKHWANAVSGVEVVPSAAVSATLPSGPSGPAPRWQAAAFQATLQAPAPPVQQQQPGQQGQWQQQWQQPLRPPPLMLQQPSPPAAAPGLLSAGPSFQRRSSTEYSLWGEDSGMPLHISSSHESLATASEMSIGSPPAHSGIAATGSLGTFGAGTGLGGMIGKSGGGFVPLQAMAEAARAAQPAQPAMAAGGGSAFSLFCNFSATRPKVAQDLQGGYALFSGPSIGTRVPAMSF